MSHNDNCSSSSKQERKAVRHQLKNLGFALDLIRSKASFLLITEQEIYLFVKRSSGLACRIQKRTGLLTSDCLREIYLDLNRSLRSKEGVALFFNSDLKLPKGITRLFRRPLSQIQLAKKDWFRILGIDPVEWEISARDSIQKAFRRKAKSVHPDKGGDSDSMIRLTRARKAAIESLIDQTADKHKRASRQTWKYWKEIGLWVR